MSEYTPTPNEARADFITLRTRNFDAYQVGRSLTSEQDFYGAQHDRMIAEVERTAAARARGEALIEVVQAHRDLHKTYGSTSACRGGIGGQALTSHCGEICYNADAHQKEMEAWQKLEVEAIEYSRARAEAYKEGKLTK